MDPITQIVVWGVIWFVLMIAATPVGGVLGALAGTLLSRNARHDEEAAFGGAFIGWIVGGLFAVFSLIQVILHIVNLIVALTS